MEQSKKGALLALAEVLAEAGVPYAIIGGVAVQVHAEDPRTTLDIDVALRARADLPRERLRAAGFEPTGTFAHSENWMGPEQTPVQFTDDPALHDAIGRALELRIEGTALRVLGKLDLLREKLRAGSDPARRRSKRMQDLADAHALVEADPGLAAALSDRERELLR